MVNQSEKFNAEKAENAVKNIESIFLIEDMNFSSDEKELAKAYLEGKMSKEEFEKRYKAAK